MTNQQNKIKCPNCDYDVDVNDILYHKIDDELKKKYQNDIQKAKESFESQKQSLDSERKKLELDKKAQQDMIDSAIQERMKAEKQQLQTKLNHKIQINSHHRM